MSEISSLTQLLAVYTNLSPLAVKKELIHIRPWNDLAEVRQYTFLWIEGYYNRRRRHSTLNYLTPHEYELGYRKLTDLAA